MPRHDLGLTLRQMLAYTREAMAIAGRTSRAGLDTDIVVARALVHTLEMIGEAARRVSEQDRVKHPSVPWQDVVDLRNRLIHGYDRVDWDTVWQIVSGDLPLLLADLERIAPGPGQAGRGGGAPE